MTLTTYTRSKLAQRLYPKFAGSPFSLIHGIAKLERRQQMIVGLKEQPKKQPVSEASNGHVL